MAQARKNSQQVTQRQVRGYLVAGVLALILVWLITLNLSIYKKERIAQAAAHESQVELSGIQTREQNLQASVNELSTERGQEGTLRETFGVAKPGEGVIVVVPQQAATTTPPESFWQQWFGWMKFW